VVFQVLQEVNMAVVLVLGLVQQALLARLA
jgi:hypothetical protein